MDHLRKRRRRTSSVIHKISPTSPNTHPNKDPNHTSSETIAFQPISEDDVRDQIQKIKQHIEHMEKDIVGIKHQITVLQNIINQTSKPTKDAIDPKHSVLKVIHDSAADDEEICDMLINHEETHPDVIVTADIHSPSFKIHPDPSLELAALNFTEDTVPSLRCLKFTSNLYNTEGIYFHAILVICYHESGSVKAWVVTLGSILVISLQFLVPGMIWVDCFENGMKLKDEQDLCGILSTRPILVLFVMSIIFVCIIYDDVKESVIEETILNYAISRRTEKIVSLRAAELLRVCLRFRRFLLPWRLAACAIWLVLSASEISTNEIVLNFLSIGFIAEADNFLGRFFVTEQQNAIADVIVNDIMDHYNEQDQTINRNISMSSFLWPRLNSVIPTIFQAIAFINITKKKECLLDLEILIRVFSSVLLPCAVILIHGVTCYAYDKESKTAFEKKLHFVGELVLNLTAFSLYVVLLMVDNPETYTDKSLSMGFVCANLFWVASLWCRNYYTHKVDYTQKTCREVFFCVCCTILIFTELSVTVMVTMSEYVRLTSY